MNTTIESKILAARRALSLVNKFKAGPWKARHVSRIFSTLNKLRAAASRCVHILPPLIDFIPGISRFYECPNCGRDAINGQTFEAWAST